MKRQMAGIACLLFCSALHAASALFSFSDVVEQARVKAGSPYQQETIAADNQLMKLSYDEYRSIRYKSSAAVWADSDSLFRIESLPAGPYSKTPVHIYFIDNGVSSAFHARPALYSYPPNINLTSDTEVPISGFRVQTQLNSAGTWDEFLVFQGASYFRAVGKGELYGISCRGLVLPPVDGKPEEFPVFTTFWIEKPAYGENKMHIYALLESDSVTGAYLFTINPGSETVMDVQAVIFSRKPVANVGIAPLTSMFYFDESNRFTADDYRTGSHDSDYFYAELESGETICRHLINPHTVSYSSFCLKKPVQFALLQRQRDLAAYQDFETHYEKRPSAIVVPGQTWPEGSLDLVEIPTADDTNDNIVSYWKLHDSIIPGHPVNFTYNVSFSDAPAGSKLAKVCGTRSGLPAYGKKDYRIYAVDFSAAEAVASPDCDSLAAAVTSSSGTVSGIHIEKNPMTGGCRLYFELHPDKQPVIELRACLLSGGNPVSETWLYRWSKE